MYVCKYRFFKRYRPFCWLGQLNTLTVPQQRSKTSPNKCLEYVTKLHLTARLYFWSFGECEYSFIAITPSSTDLEW